MKNKLPSYLYGSWLLSLTLLLAIAPAVFAQSNPRSIESNSTSINTQSHQFPAAYYNSSWTVFSERIDGVGETTVRSVNPNNFNVPNSSTSTAPERTLATVVYDNGPHINQFGTPDLSLLESVTLGMNSLGGNIKHSLDYAIADNFELVAETEITSITVYAYQTGATSTTINAMYVTIWDGDPSDGTSSVVWGDNTTNVFSSVENSGVYRVSETSLGDRNRLLQKVKADISGPTLDAGTYWLQYSLDGTESSGPWQPPIVILGENTTGDALQLVSTGWQPLLDTGTNTPQGIPFQIEGIESGGGGNVYCIPEGTNAARYIDNFSTTDGSENISNMGSGFSTGGYGDFYDTHTVAQEQGETVEFSVDIEGGTAGFRVWVDWNQDGVFDEIDEVAYASSGYIASHTGSITVPADALEGDTRMRIVSHWLSQTGDVDPCKTGFTYGEFEDYKFTVEGTGGGGLVYCIPEGTNAGRYIDNFSTTGGSDNISNMGSGFSPDGYGDFYDTHTVTQEQGETVEFSVDIEGGTAGFRVWVDWNQDGEFDEIDEVAYASSGYIASHTGSITVPADALEGDTRMRIVSHWLSQTGDVDPCATGFTYGEFEDYKFTVVEGTGGGGGSNCLTTLFASNNGGSAGWAQLFDVAVKGSDLSINNIAVNTSATTGPVNLEVYIIEGGTYVGNETNPSAWGATPISTGSGTAMGTDNSTSIDLDTPISLNANEDYAFAIFLDQGPRYTNGTGSNQHYENGELEIDLGTAVAGFFTGSVFPDRIFNGTLCYDIDGGGGGGSNPCSQGAVSNNMENGWGNAHLLLLANDFVVAEDETFTLEEMAVNFLLVPGFDIVSADIFFYEDTGGNGPGTEVPGTSSLGAVPDSQNVIGNHPAGFDLVEGIWTLDTPITFEGGASGEKVYWMGMQIEYAGASSYIETTTIYDTPNESYLSEDEGVTWESGIVVFGDDMHGVITFSGLCEGGGGGGSGYACEQDFELSLEDGVGDLKTLLFAEDFEIAADETMSVEKVTYRLFNNIGEATTIAIYKDDGTGIPGDLVESFSNVAPDSQTVVGNNYGFDAYDILFTLPSVVELEAGIYWVALQVTEGTDGGTNYWIITDDGVHAPGHYTSDGGVTWVQNSSSYDFSFKVEGECTSDGGGGGNEGEDCEAPIVVTTLPYDDAGNTADYGNFYSNGDVPPLAPDAVTTGTGSEYYLSGDEVVYAYTPVENEVLNISTTNDDDWIGLWAFTGCPFTSTVGYHTSIDGDTRLIQELPVTAGETYYFVISTWAPPESTEYTIHIEKVGGGSGNACEQVFFDEDQTTGVGFSDGNIVANDITVAAGESFTMEMMTFDVVNLGGEPSEFDLEIFEDNGSGGVGASTGITNHFDSSNMTFVENGTFAGYTQYTVTVTLPNIELTADASDDARYWLAIASELSTTGDWTYWVSYDYVTNPDSFPTWQYTPADGWFNYDGGSVEGIMTVSGICEGGGGGGSSDCITTIYDGGNNGSPGGAVYFDVTVGPEDIELTSLDLSIDNSGTSFSVDVYTIVGTYVGNETNQAVWTLQTEGTGTSAGEGNPSSAELVDTFTLSANTTYGMALVIDSTHSLYYTNGDGSNEHFENDDLALDLGAATNVPFTPGVFAPRVFNGGLCYNVGGGGDPIIYCEPELDCTDGDVITNVTFQEIDNTTACSPNGYGDYTHLVATVQSGGTYPISVTVGDGWAFESVSVWIDFDNSGTFDEDEFFYIGTGSDEALTGDIDILAGLADGQYRMRVRVAAVGEGTATWDMACDESQGFGETEDYTVEVDGVIGIEDQSNTVFSYYPNPTNGVVNITANKDVSSVAVYNILGQQVLEKNRLDNGQVDVSALMTGTYLFRVKFEDGSVENFKVLRE